MNRAFQILLIVALLAPLASVSREETMEDRKRRITRKYMRERGNVVQSDLLVPVEELPEDVQVADSERFKVPEVGFERQEPGARPMPPPQARRPVPASADRNWLLAEDPLATEPYADPYGKAEAEKKSEPAIDWSTWGRPEEKEPGIGSRPAYSRSVENPYTKREQDQINFQERSSFMDPRDPRASGLQSKGLLGNTVQPGGGHGVFGAQQDKDAASQNTSGLLKVPYSTSRDRYDYNAQEKQRRAGGAPYKNPYESQRPRHETQSGVRQKPVQEYKRVDPFQQWKDKNKTWDPMKDDAYIDEMMQTR
ncbi:hypothetical protein [Pontiella sulfatireligans]|uniref:Uncharacterized protein n=1 Tax=Pontiella sulfatireligans TaxID=2750658 RepID=A0A6C2UMA0_9BACT|nr:hypothetical protein [Pontiella sulfatireligans]VGO21385.1 hypothetical protein SCARR_03458 [Pontiella sulfatireligans]